jgi:hypothetical protein
MRDAGLAFALKAGALFFHGIGSLFDLACKAFTTSPFC